MRKSNRKYNITAKLVIDRRRDLADLYECEMNKSKNKPGKRVINRFNSALAKRTCAPEKFIWKRHAIELSLRNKKFHDEKAVVLAAQKLDNDLSLLKNIMILHGFSFLSSVMLAQAGEKIRDAVRQIEIDFQEKISISMNAKGKTK